MPKVVDVRIGQPYRTITVNIDDVVGITDNAQANIGTDIVLDIVDDKV